jgi:hypothetical protein
LGRRTASRPHSKTIYSYGYSIYAWGAVHERPQERGTICKSAAQTMRKTLLARPICGTWPDVKLPAHIKGDQRRNQIGDIGRITWVADVAARGVDVVGDEIVMQAMGVVVRNIRALS